MGAPKVDKEDLFDIADFNSVRVKVRIENQTSKTSVGGDTRTYGEREFEADPAKVDIRLMEFKPKGLALDVPGKVGAVGHVLDIELDVQGASLPLCFKVRGKVAAIQALENDRERMDVDLIEVNQRFHDALRSLFQKRQEEIDVFLASMKH
jgi:hypothetical protein